MITISISHLEKKESVPTGFLSASERHQHVDVVHAQFLRHAHPYLVPAFLPVPISTAADCAAVI